MAWEPPSDRLVARFDALLPRNALIVRRKMFGCPCAFVNGNMFAGVYQQSIVLRLPEDPRSALLHHGRAQPFTVRGRTMREYALIPEALEAVERDLAEWIRQAFEFARGLAPKASKTRKNAAKPAKARRSAAPRKAR
jgi:TfoX/Sxy family transcriptional regulator of competence genes